MTAARDTATAAPHAGRTTPCRDRPEDAFWKGYRVRAVFGPNTPRVLQFLINLRKLSPAEIDIVATSWNEVNPVDRAVARAHLQLATAAKEEYPVAAAASAGRRAAMDTARVLGRNDWAFWAAASDAAAAVTADDLAEGDYETLTSPLRTVMPAVAARPG